MLLSRVKRISGIIRIRLLIPDFETNLFTDQYVYSGGLCLELIDGKSVFTNYIPGIISADFYTYKEINIQNDIIDDITLEKINWSNAHKLTINSMSKQWDYVRFGFFDLGSVKQDLISFPKINKIAGDFSPSKSYSLFGSCNHRINIQSSVKTNLIHDSFVPQIFYLGDQVESYSGSLIYTICENSGSYYLEVLGITSNDYDGKSRIVPLEYFQYNDLTICCEITNYNPTLTDLMEIPIVKSTQYPQFTKNFFGIKKDDIAIIINGLNIIYMEVFNTKYNQRQTIDEYLTYLFQKQHTCQLTLIRKGKIIDVQIDKTTFVFNTVNPIYLNINDLYVSGNQIKFSSDICDSMLQYDIYNKEIVKYLNDPTYKIEKINV
jgi:hypothetical protein